MKRLILPVLIAALTGSFLQAQAQDKATAAGIVPAPVSVSVAKDHFTLKSSTRILAVGAGAKDPAEMLAALLNTPTGYNLRAAESHSGRKGNAIILKLSSSPDSRLGREGYILQASHRQVLLTANQPAGLFYGIQTLLQLLPPEIESRNVIENMEWTIAGAMITDYPRFGWRGLMLDVSRHFFSKEFLKRYMDEMAKYKFNVFHLHLADDQGWRLEIKSLPALTEKGAWRVPRQGKWWSFLPPQPGEEASYGGYYTQEDIRELVQYARERFITIVPEIDVPGHSLAAIAAYPELACAEGNYHVNPGSRFYGVEDNALCIGNEQVFGFLDKVFTEVAGLFPSEYIHVGGDEAFKGFWEKCPKCQRRMREEGLANVDELQSYFIKRIEKLLHAKGKKLIGWDEILEGGLAPDATVMSWRGMEGGIKAARMNHHVVMTPSQYAYLDLYQGDPLVEPETYSILRLSSCYHFEPVPEGVDPQYILGGQGNLWTESVPTERHAEYMTWPRALALSEVFWSPRERRDWPDFIRRMERKFTCMDQAEVNYSRSAYDAIITGVKDANDSLQIRLETEIPGLDIHYTFDETDPDPWQPRYEGEPLDIPKGASQIKVRTFRSGEPAGRQINCPISEAAKRIEND